MANEQKTRINTLMGTSLPLLSLIDYQVDAVVSKTLEAKQSGTVTVFAFDEGQGLSEHTAPFDALAYVFDGEARVTIDGKEQVTRSGEMIIMPANVPHALKAAMRFKMLLIMIKSN